MGASSPQRLDAKDVLTENRTMRSPPRSENMFRRSMKKEGFQWRHKITTLPRISEELRKIIEQYIKFKRYYIYLGRTLNFTEWMFATIWAYVMSISFAKPWVHVTYGLLFKVKILDDFVCHQLDFFEVHLQEVDTAFIYRPGGLLSRFVLFANLFIRIFFFFPRIYVNMVMSCFNVLSDEITDDVELFGQVFLRVHDNEKRRTLRKRSRRSPSKKRKHEDVVTAGEADEYLPEYLVCVPNYSEDADPDYVPDSDGDDTEITSASDRSYESEDDGLSGEGEGEMVLKKETAIEEELIDNVVKSVALQ